MTGQCFYRNHHNRKYILIGRTGILTSFMTNLDGDKVGALCQWIRHPARLETRVEYCVPGACGKWNWRIPSIRECSTFLASTNIHDFHDRRRLYIEFRIIHSSFSQAGNDEIRSSEVHIDQLILPDLRMLVGVRLLIAPRREPRSIEACESLT